MLPPAALVALGGLLGGLGRAGVGQVLPVGPALLLVDVAGAGALGLLLAARPSPSARLLWGTGALGSWTTVSGLALAVVAPGGSAAAAVAWAGVTVALGGVAAGAGLRAGGRPGGVGAPPGGAVGASAPSGSSSAQGRVAVLAVGGSVGAAAVVGAVVLARSGGPGEAVLVAAGAAAGALLRRAVVTTVPTDPRAAVAGVNVVGSGLLGLLVSAGAADGDVGGPLLAVGLCGAFTTFSTAAVDVVRTTPRRATAGLAVAHVVGSLLAAAVGLRVGELLGG